MGFKQNVFHAIGRTEEPPMTRFVALQLGVDHYFDISLARRLLDFSPRMDRGHQIELMQRWLVQLAKS